MTRPPAALKSRFLRETSHLLMLWAFAVAQPLFAMLSAQTGFLTAGQFAPADIVVLTLALSLGLPLLPVAVKELAGLFSPRLREMLHTLWMALLLALVVMPLLNRLGLPLPWLTVVLAILAGAGLTWLYRRQAKVQELASFLSLTVILFPLLFLLTGPVSALLSARPETYGNPKVTPAMASKTYPPVVMVIWDELPLTSLLDERGELDSVRFPHFAELASGATWYSNLETVGGSTLWAVPSILCGQMPHHGEQASDSELRTNLFTLLSETHAMRNVVEKHTRMCPPGLCKVKKPKPFKKLMKTLPDLAAVYLHTIAPAAWLEALPDVSNNWGDFSWGKAKAKRPSRTAAKPLSPEAEKRLAAERAEARQQLNEAMAVANHKRNMFRHFVKKMTPSDSRGRPTLNFIHLVFPHVPYNYLPSGKYYSIAAYKYFATWQNERAIFYDYQRHMMQLGAVDALMGDLIARLKKDGMYDRALIVVTADHGASWAGVGTERRKLGPDNYTNVMPVPLIIKLPGQRQPRVETRRMRTVDILPTMAEALHLPLPGPVDGHSALSAEVTEPADIRIIDNVGERWMTFPWVTTAQKQANVARKIRWFGAGDMQKIYTTAPFFNALLGRPLSALRVAAAPADAWTVALESPENYTAVDLSGDFIPAQIEGWLSVRRKGQAFPQELAVAVNDVVWATYPYFRPDGDRLRFEAMAPESAFKAGKNSIRVFAIDGRTPPYTLTEIPFAAP
ncbi:MAG: sulfatase-like hydrolase/transferase [Candidatus Melainabacteria bacterium]